MRLLILHLASVFGGAERTTSNLLRYLDRDRVTHVTLASTAALRPFLPDRFDDFIDTAPHLPRGWFTDSRDLLRDARVAGALIREAEPDLVLGMMHYSAALAVFGTRLSRVPARTIGSFRGPVFEHMRHYERGLRRRTFLRLAVGATARLADRMIVPSRGTADELRRHFLGARERTVVIPNGIDNEEVALLAEEPTFGLEHLDPALPLLCVAARLSPEKDIGLLLEAFRRVQDVCPSALAIVGDGPECIALERLIDRWGLGERVAFVGHRENVYPYLRRADLYVHTCKFEGFGYTMLEAMSCGTPVVATDCPYGPREVIGDDRFGLLVRPEDPLALADGIQALLLDPARRQGLRDRGLERAQELSTARMAERYGAVFADLMPPSIQDR
ncbi:glycosyltransferase [Thiorhodococcus fuscus]|uniref:Glycosyltransferase n=1 Tax=Thiorhodococcus fuscus TaxID=527200 RepID=A0ABW4Y8G1_9GAMM